MTVRNRRTPKCSTWNNLIKFAVCISFSASIFLFSFPRVSAVSVGATPISGGNVGGLLSSMGYLDVRDDGLYDWRRNYPSLYTQDIFGNWVPKIKSGEPLSDDDLAPLLGTAIPEDTYTYDSSGNYYVGSKKVTASDLFLNAKSLIATNYGMPVNVSGAQFDVGTYSSTDVYRGICLSPSDWGKDTWYFPYVHNSQGDWIEGSAFSLVDEATRRVENLNMVTLKGGYNPVPKIGRYVYYPLNFDANLFLSSDSVYTSGADSGVFLANTPNRNMISVQKLSMSYVYESDCQHALLFTRGKPTYTMEGDSEQLGNAIVQVKPSDDDDNNGSSPPTPQSPNGWEIWQTVTDLIRQIDTGEVTNGGTDYQQYVNNNYNYVDVDINVPDTIHNDVTISGGLDVTGSGDVDITIHEDISLPSAGDGTSFYSPDATDAIGALVKDNPVISVISGVFSAIDPALVGVFSISVSLLLVLGIWKLIRG